jgi:hypothetical protein
VKLYEMGQLSSGAAAQLAGVPKPYFLGKLADYGVNTFDLSEEEIPHDFRSASGGLQYVSNSISTPGPAVAAVGRILHPHAGSARRRG